MMPPRPTTRPEVEELWDAVHGALDARRDPRSDPELARRLERCPGVARELDALLAALGDTPAATAPPVRRRLPRIAVTAAAAAAVLGIAAPALRLLMEERPQLPDPAGRLAISESSSEQATGSGADPVREGAANAGSSKPSDPGGGGPQPVDPAPVGPAPLDPALVDPRPAPAPTAPLPGVTPLVADVRLEVVTESPNLRRRTHVVGGEITSSVELRTPPAERTVLVFPERELTAANVAVLRVETTRP